MGPNSTVGRRVSGSGYPGSYGLDHVMQFPVPPYCLKFDHQQIEEGPKRKEVTMCDAGRQDAELKKQVHDKLRTVTDSLEKLRLNCLSRGSGGIKGISRFVTQLSFKYAFRFSYDITTPLFECWS